MEVRRDYDTYARLQHLLLLNIARGIRDELRSAGLAPSQVRDLTGSLTAAAAIAIDACDIFDKSVLPIRAYVTFGGMGLGKEVAVFGNGNAGLEDLAYYAADELFEIEP